MGMRAGNEAVLRPHLELVTSEPAYTKFQVQFRQAYLIILLGL
jgi:hypothetical protein